MTHYACHYLSQDFPKYVPKSTNSVDSPQRLKKKPKPKTFHSQIHLGNIQAFFILEGIWQDSFPNVSVF